MEFLPALLIKTWIMCLALRMTFIGPTLELHDFIHDHNEIIHFSHPVRTRAHNIAAFTSVS